MADILVAGCGVATAACFLVAVRVDPAAMAPSFSPLAWPSLPTPGPGRRADRLAAELDRSPAAGRYGADHSVITFENVGVQYADADAPVLSEVSFTVPEGDLALVVGRTGTGKSTLLGTVNGLVPHFTGGTLTGRVVVDGIDTRHTRPRELAAVVGVVGQDPLAGFVTDTVEEELAYGMEQLAVARPPCASGSKRRSTCSASPTCGTVRSGRCPVGSSSGSRSAPFSPHTPGCWCWTSRPRRWIPVAAEEVLATLARLVDDLGVTILMAEHRLERALSFAHRLVYVRGDGSVETGEPAELMQHCELVPPLIELGRAGRLEAAAADRPRSPAAGRAAAQELARADGFPRASARRSNRRGVDGPQGQRPVRPDDGRRRTSI